MKKIVSLLLVLVMTVALAACGSNNEGNSGDYEYKGDRLTIGGADSTGTMYAAAVAIATNFTNYVDGLNVDPSTSTGSNQNALDVHDGEVELGMCSGDAGYNATHGLGKFDGNKIEDIRCVGCVYSSVVSLVALKSSGFVTCTPSSTALTDPPGMGTSLPTI